MVYVEIWQHFDSFKIRCLTDVQHGKFGQKMAVAKHPASRGNTSHIETFNGVFWFKTSK